jgi:hypothetical protein
MKNANPEMSSQVLLREAIDRLQAGLRLSSYYLVRRLLSSLDSEFFVVPFRHKTSDRFIGKVKF